MDDIEEFARRGRAAQQAVNDLGAGKPDPVADALGEFRSTHEFLSGVVADMHAADVASFITGYVVGESAARDRTIATAADMLDGFARDVGFNNPQLADRMHAAAAELRNPKP